MNKPHTDNGSRTIGSIVLVGLLLVASLWVAWPPETTSVSDSPARDEAEQPAFIHPELAIDETLPDDAPESAETVEPPVIIAEPKPEPVVTQKPAPTPNTSDVSWVVQVGTFSDKANAEKLRDRLIANNFQSFLEPVLLAEGKQATRVRVGPFESKNQAGLIKDALLRQLKINGFVKETRADK